VTQKKRAIEYPAIIPSTLNSPREITTADVVHRELYGEFASSHGARCGIVNGFMDGDLHFSVWLVLGALGIGLNKGGLTGLGILFVVLFAMALPPRASTGLVLPLLLVGDVCAIVVYRRMVIWPVFLRLLPPTLAGVVLGYFAFGYISAKEFGPLIGWIILALVAVQLVRETLGTRLDRLFHSHLFGAAMGVLAGMTTMIANAAGPVANLYFLSIRLPKMNLIGTSAWFFFAVNLSKVPFSAHLGLINRESLHLTLLLAPLVLVGFACGKWLAAIMPQKIFERFLLLCTFFGALKLIW
jgi:uncharacterized membrane protein YfcA